jgi:2-polyprenyl-6-methoxyphenol hydroxylase-like FAD-dependent oxidoreductase
MSSPPKFSILTIGSGIAGLAVSLCLAKKGHPVHVLERHSKLSLNGGAILLGPNATRIFAGLGVLQDLQNVAEDAPLHVLRRYDNSELIQKRFSTFSSSFP